ncbi:cytoplasmic dynein 2 intermediate chain 2 [Lepeophtheirus salmonis]|uniref:cytoplasmic dynein 2 intermediate chain 2 n=1 Tax=Lepeophtheirus salmonis TaxID=72036 RepID=UPI001AE337CE|nr:cytoplasmic dynein 2 intermediate chain 2-like [Lepeophtheirus salmonis]
MIFQDKNAIEFDFERDFPPTWRVEKKKEPKGMQTESWGRREVGSQVKIYQEKAVQTHKEIEKTIDEYRLDKFLIEARGVMEKELKASRESRAFEGYEGLKDSSENAHYRNIHTLSGSKKDEGEDLEDISVSSLSWNLANTTIVVGYAVNEEHNDWCGHSSSIHIWSLTKRSFNPKEPHFKVSCPTCIGCISHHPSDSEAFAAGGYSGELFYYSSRDDYSTPIVSTSNGHRERITCLEWTTLGIDGKYLIVSAGLDGKILIWFINEIQNKLEAQKQFKVHADNLPRSLKLKSRMTAEVGITTISIDLKYKDGLVIGTEAGVIIFTSIGLFNNLTEDDWMIKSEITATIFSPIHKGKVMALDFSPFQNQIFLSSGSDMEIRLYSVIYPQSPIRIISIEDIALHILWSKRSPSIFTYLTEYNVQTFNLLSEEKGCIIKENDGKYKKLCISKDGKVAALGDKDGKTMIFKVKEELVPESENQKFSTLINKDREE